MMNEEFFFSILGDTQEFDPFVVMDCNGKMHEI
jgi:hypothetical protein